jgi:uncharacterized membrane protein
MNTQSLISLLAAIGCGLVGGFFYAFSICIMRALAALPPSQGVAAMQSINVAVINPWFLTLFVGLVAPCLWLVVASGMHWQDPGARYRLFGGLLYLLGTFLVTMSCNVPRNDALAAVASSSAEAATLWASYVPSWTMWNHVRGACSCAASLLFTLSLRTAG